MDENVVSYVAWKVDGEHKTFLKKNTAGSIYGFAPKQALSDTGRTRDGFNRFIKGRH